jgi:hypothetical protein
MTNVAVPSQDGKGLHDGRDAGVWHKQWSPSQKGKWIEQFCKIALSKPFVSSVTYANLADNENSSIAHSGMLTSKLEPKESFKTIKKLHDSIFS